MESTKCMLNHIMLPHKSPRCFLLFSNFFPSKLNYFLGSFFKIYILYFSLLLSPLLILLFSSSISFCFTASMSLLRFHICLFIMTIISLKFLNIYNSCCTTLFQYLSIGCFFFFDNECFLGSILIVLLCIWCVGNIEIMIMFSSSEVY